MAIVGFSFTKILAEKTAPVRSKVEISNNVQVLDVVDANLSMGPGKKGIRVRFQFSSIYKPDIGQILMEGDIILLEEGAFADDAIARWAKEKALQKELLGVVLNHVLDKSNVEALILARDLALPAPVPLPKVNIQQGTAPSSVVPADSKGDAKKQKPKK